MSVITVTAADQGGTVTLQPGQRLIVQLAENPTTGFRWAKVQGDEEIIPLKDSTYVVISAAAIGGGGQRNFIFEAGKPGSTPLQFKLWREWEGESSVQQRFGIKLVVSP